MSDSYKLPDFVISQLYGNNLVTVDAKISRVEPQAPENVTTTDNTQIQYLGSNERNVTIFTSAEHQVYIDENDLDFLTKILGACNLSLKDVAIVNLFRTQQSGNEVLKITAAKKAIIFIPQPNILGLEGNIPLYRKISFNGVDCIFANELTPLSGDKKLKADLWNELKTFF